MNDRSPFPLAHVSDTHIGYEPSLLKARAADGENQRGRDIISAFHRAVDDIVAWDPPLVVHSGDVAERHGIPVRHMLFVQSELARLAGRRADGSRRQVVVIAGNHDAPAHRREPCFLELFAGHLPGVHIVTDRMKVIDFTAVSDAPAELAGVAVTAVPHDTLKDIEHLGLFDTISPQADRTNILVGHGVAGGSTLYHRSIGREYALPTEVLGRDWDYVALGHWHKQGPIHLNARSDSERSRIWYAGSLENLGFGDLMDNHRPRGWLKVTVNPSELPDVETSPVPIRPMFRLPVIDAAGKSPADITDKVLANAQAAHDAGTIAEAVIEQIIVNVPRDIWNLVDTAAAVELMDPALHYAISPKWLKQTADVDGTVDPGDVVGGYEFYRQLIETDIAPEVLAGVDAGIAEDVTALLFSLLRSELKVEDDTPDTPDTAVITETVDAEGEAA